MGSKIQVFEDKKVRSYWDAEAEEWYFSVVDVVATPERIRYLSL